MTKDEVLKLAKECGADDIGVPDTYVTVKLNGHFVMTEDQLLAFANAIDQKASEAQREKDAKICEEHAADYSCVGIALYDGMESGARSCAAAIRANKE